MLVKTPHLPRLGLPLLLIATSVALERRPLRAAFLSCSVGHGGLSRKPSHRVQLRACAASLDGPEDKRPRALVREARLALIQAELAERRAMELKGRQGMDLLPDLEGWIRVKLLWRRMGNALYRTWIRVFMEVASSDPLRLYKSSPFMDERERKRLIDEAFNQLELHAGSVDRRSLTDVVARAWGKLPASSVVDKLMEECDANQDGRIDREEFEDAVRALLDYSDAKGMQVLLRQRAVEERAAILEALKQVKLEGGGAQTAKDLDNLRLDGRIKLWNSASVVLDNTTNERVKAETNIANLEEQLGLRPSLFTRFRYVGVRYLGIIGFLLLVMANHAKATLAGSIAQALGAFSCLVYLVFVIFARQIDRLLQRIKVHMAPDGSGRDRWARREAGRLLAAYVHGVPIAAVARPHPGLREVAVYPRREGEWDMQELQRSISVDGYMSAGLSKSQLHKQAAIQMTGLMAEAMKHGNAIEGFRYLAVLERLVLFSQRPLSREDRQALLRWGVVHGHRLLKQHAAAFEGMVKSFQQGDELHQVVGELETAGGVSYERHLKMLEAEDETPQGGTRSPSAGSQIEAAAAAAEEEEVDYSQALDTSMKRSLERLDDAIATRSKTEASDKS
mmetsp:Transcript_10297/g.34376  ORF Transcript_10297/g.34376 Transcript_10297/m.34376 type:complete len:621 (-) Transcript_10297:793-2655(-)